MANLRYIIIDEDNYSAKYLMDMIGDIRPTYHLEAVIEESTEARQFLSRNKVDLIFSEIDLEEGDFFSSFTPPLSSGLIFVTSEKRSTQESEHFSPISYLLKPVDKEELDKALSEYESKYAKFLS